MVKPKMKALPADNTNTMTAAQSATWFNQRHNDEALIDAESDPQKKFELIGEALHNRLKMAHLAGRLPVVTETDQPEQHYVPIGDTILTNEHTQGLISEFAKFAGKYGDFFVKHARKNEQDPLLDLGSTGSGGTAAFSLPRLFDIGHDNPEFIKEVMDNPEMFGSLLVNSGVHDAAGRDWKSSIQSIKERQDSSHLKPEALNASLAISGLNPEKVQELGFSKKAAKYFKDVKLYGDVKNKLALAIDPKDTAKFDPLVRGDYLKSLYSNRFYAQHNFSKMNDPEDIHDMMKIAANNETQNNDTGFNRVAHLINMGLNATPEQWLEHVKQRHSFFNDSSENRTGDVKITPDIPVDFAKNPDHLKTIMENWNWENWNLHTPTGLKHDEHLFTLRDHHPELLQNITSQINGLEGDDKYKLNHVIQAFGNAFDETGNYRKDSFDRSALEFGINDPNVEKFRDYIAHHTNEALMNPTGDRRTEMLVDKAMSPKFMHKMSPQIANSLYALATHHNATANTEGTRFGREWERDPSAVDRDAYAANTKRYKTAVDLEKVFANAMMTRPEYQNLKEASKFWNDYEKEVKASHFPVAEAAMTGEHKTHVPFRKKSYEKGMLNENGEETFSSAGSEHLWPSLKGHAQLSQSAVLMRYIKDKSAEEAGRVVNGEVVPDKTQSHHPFHAPKFRNINGKLHVKVYRGIAGQHGADLMDIHQQGQPFKTAGVQSFTLDPETASWFALERQKEFNEKHLIEHTGQGLDHYIKSTLPSPKEGENPYTHSLTHRVMMSPLVGRAAVVEGWMPVEDIAHFGAVNRDTKDDYGSGGELTKFKPEHSQEQELVFLSRNHEIPHTHFRVHDAHKFWNKLKESKNARKRKRDEEELLKDIPGRISDMPVLDTSFSELIGLSHGHHKNLPKKVFADSLEVTPDTKESSYKQYQPKQGVVEVKGVPVQTQLPEIKPEDKPARDPLRTRHTMKKSEEGESDE